MKRIRQSSKIQRAPRFASFLQDIWRTVLFIIVFGADLGIVLFLPRIQTQLLDIAGRVLALFLGHLIVVILVREIVPRSPVGSIRVGKDLSYIKWLIAGGFTDVINCRLFSGPYALLHCTRYLYFRVQRAKLAYSASIHPTVRVSDPSLLVVEDGAQLEAGIIVECAAHAMGRVKICGVAIGEGALVGAHVQLMPGASLGPNARIGPGAYIGPDVCVGLGVKIGEGAVLAADVDLGSYVRIGAGAIIAEGVSIGEYAKIRAGSIIPPNTRIRAGEVWQGLPARAVFRDNRSTDVKDLNEH